MLEKIIPPHSPFHEYYALTPKIVAPDDCTCCLTKTCSDSPFASTQVKNVKSWGSNTKISHEVQLQSVFVTANGCNSSLITFHIVSSQTVWAPIFSFVFIDYLRYIPQFKWNKLYLSKLLKISFFKDWQISFIIFLVYILTTFASILLLIKFHFCMVDQKHGNSLYHWSYFDIFEFLLLLVCQNIGLLLCYHNSTSATCQDTSYPQK